VFLVGARASIWPGSHEFMTARDGSSAPREGGFLMTNGELFDLNGKVAVIPEVTVVSVAASLLD